MSNNTDGNKLMIFSSIAWCFGDTNATSSDADYGTHTILLMRRYTTSGRGNNPWWERQRLYSTASESK